MAFKTMPKELTLKLLEEYEDTLSGPLQELHSRIKGMSCPNCKNPMLPKPDFENPFVGDSHIPRFLAYCSECEMIIDINSSVKTNALE